MLEENYRDVKESLTHTTRLIAVSKFKPKEDIERLYAMGQRDFGENRVQELIEKQEALPSDIRWHFIGKLQTNKVKYLTHKVHIIHSLDSLPLAKEIEKQFSKIDGIAHCLIQVNIGNDENKSGIEPHLVSDFIESMKPFSHIKILGFMTILPIVDSEKTRSLFEEMKGIFDQFKTLELGGKLPQNVTIQELSMGMSEDYLDAQNCGATLVRVGSKIFGNR